MTVLNVIRRPVTVIVQGRGLMGFKGDKGDPAPNTIWQYSADNITWTTSVPDGVRYMRESTDNGTTWSTAIELPTVAALALKAPLASPTFTGDVIVPDQTAGNNSTKAANTKYIDKYLSKNVYLNSLTLVRGSVSASTGANISGNIARWRTDYLPCKSGTSVTQLDGCLFGDDDYLGFRIFVYDADKVFIESSAESYGEGKSYVVGHDGYIRVLLRSAHNTDFIASDYTENFMISYVENVWEYVDTITDTITDNVADLTDKLSGIFDWDSDISASFASKLVGINTAESYLYFTDPHLMGQGGVFDEDKFYRYMNTVKGIYDTTPVNFVVCAGDWLSGGDTIAQACHKLSFVDGKMRSFFDTYYLVVGNHDTNYLGVDSENVRLNSSLWFGNNTFVNLWFRKQNSCHYAFDGRVSRNYVLNTGTDHDTMSSSKTDQLDWLAGRLIADDPPRATIIMHIYYLIGTTVPKFSLALGAVVAAYNSHTSVTLTTETHGYAKSYDFTGKTGHIDYILAGHSHSDFNITVGGVPCVGTLNLQSGEVPTFDLVCADYDNSKLYLIRVGTGSNRTIDL